MPTRLRARPKLRQKSGLADARLTDERDRTPLTSIQLIQKALERGHLVATSDQTVDGPSSCFT